MVKRFEKALRSSGIEFEELMSWSVHLAKFQSHQAQREDKGPSAKHLKMIEHQAAVINQLIDLSKGLSDRLRDLEKEVGRKDLCPEPDMPKKRQLEKQCDETPVKRRKRQNTHLWETWYEWIACRAFASEEDKQWKSTMRKMVGYVLLFAESLDLAKSRLMQRVCSVVSSVVASMGTDF